MFPFIKIVHRVKHCLYIYVVFILKSFRRPKLVKLGFIQDERVIFFMTLQNDILYVASDIVKECV